MNPSLWNWSQCWPAVSNRFQLGLTSLKLNWVTLKLTQYTLNKPASVSCLHDGYIANEHDDDSNSQHLPNLQYMSGSRISTWYKLSHWNLFTTLWDRHSQPHLWMGILTHPERWHCCHYVLGAFFFLFANSEFQPAMLACYNIWSSHCFSSGSGYVLRVIRNCLVSNDKLTDDKATGLGAMASSDFSELLAWFGALTHFCYLLGLVFWCIIFQLNSWAEQIVGDRTRTTTYIFSLVSFIFHLLYYF
jgi:hypothetical protein